MGYPMSKHKDTQIVNDPICDYAYASAYAIQMTPITIDDDGDAVCKFANIKGVTEWASNADLYKSAEDAMEAIIRERRTSAYEGFPRVIQLQLTAHIKAVDTAAINATTRVA